MNSKMVVVVFGPSLISFMGHECRTIYQKHVVARAPQCASKEKVVKKAGIRVRRWESAKETSKFQRFLGRISRCDPSCHLKESLGPPGPKSQEGPRKVH